MIGGIFIITHTLKKIIEVLLAISLGLTAIFVFVNVILRYIFGSGLTWAVELSSILFLVIIVLGSILALVEDDHIKVDVLINAVPPKVRLLLSAVSTILILITLYILGAGSYTLMIENQILTTPVLGIPQSYIYSLGLILSVALAVVVINNLIRTLRNKGELPNKDEELEGE